MSVLAPAVELEALRRASHDTVGVERNGWRGSGSVAPAHYALSECHWPFSKRHRPISLSPTAKVYTPSRRGDDTSEM
jgi:hypothetical protein